jgi:molybdate transport system substrate-binding protein
VRVLFVLLLAVSLRGDDLQVAAASDLAPLQKQLEEAFRLASGKRVRFVTASSGSLKQQIQNGAPYDVFLSANQEYVRELARSSHIDPATVVIYAQGRIALWSADGKVKSLHDLPNLKHVAIPNPGHAPYGVAARQALEKQGLWKRVEPAIVYGENVRQALQFAETRNADAVITSWTLLLNRGTLIPAEWHAPILQSGGVVAATKQPQLARAFLDFLVSSAGRKILAAGGLQSPSGN